MNDTVAALHDRRMIEELVYRWACARESDDWNVLADCFHADAHIHNSWTSATAWTSATGEEFAKRSRAMAVARKPGVHMKHIISDPWGEVRGTRGFRRSNAALLIRDDKCRQWMNGGAY